jgi:hypothetical protein
MDNLKTDGVEYLSLDECNERIIKHLERALESARKGDVKFIFSAYHDATKDNPNRVLYIHNKTSADRLEKYRDSLSDLLEKFDKATNNTFVRKFFTFLKRRKYE